ncbi:MAG: T9SS type A sorting domain-containing protein [Bacteroidales bacterium]
MDDFSSAPSFLQYGSLTFSGGGQAYVEQYLTKDVWHMVSMPVNAGIIEVYLWNYLAQFAEPSGSWATLSLPVTIPMNVGEGYFAWNYSVDPNGQWPISPDSVVFYGTLNDQDVNLSLSNTDASPSSGWNLLGNPFPVAIEWNSSSDWNRNNVGAVMYLFDPDNTGNYVTWNYNTGIGTNPNGGFIASTQGFWVRTSDTTGTAASITIPASQRFHNNAAFLKSDGVALPDHMLVTVEGENYKDQTILGFIETATGEFDPDYDGLYLKPNVNSLSLYTSTNGSKYAINELPSVKEYPLVPLIFKATTNGMHTLSFSWVESFDSDQPIYLEDKKEKRFKDIRLLSEYKFDAGIDDTENRFFIHFVAPNVTENPMDYVNIYSWQKNVVVEIPFETDGTISVYDIAGRQVAMKKAFFGKNEIQLTDSKGNYIVRFISSEGMANHKVNIQ